MFAVGLGSLGWGPASDRYGRKVVYLVAAAFFLASSIVCIFAPSIGVLIAVRAVQGAAGEALSCRGPLCLICGRPNKLLPFSFTHACLLHYTVSAFIAVGGGVIADIFPPGVSLT